MYDYLMERRGQFIPRKEFREVWGKGVQNSKNLRDIVERLQNDYGLDIRCTYMGWALVGEWVGRVYVDYLEGEAVMAADS